LQLTFFAYHEKTASSKIDTFNYNVAIMIVWYINYIYCNYFIPYLDDEKNKIDKQLISFLDKLKKRKTF